MKWTCVPKTWSSSCKEPVAEVAVGYGMHATDEDGNLEIVTPSYWKPVELSYTVVLKTIVSRCCIVISVQLIGLL